MQMFLTTNLRRVTALLVIVAAGVAGCGGSEQPGAGSGEGDGSQPLRISKAGWKTDFSKTTVALSEFQSGGPPRDGIPPIDDPKPTSQEAADAWLEDREPVLVVEVGDQARAYPIQILIWHEIANDELGNRPIAVTYCPLCNSSVVFDRRVEGRTLTFGTTGNLRKSDLVMWDRQTESWWQQLSAEAVVGELAGTKLEVLPSQTLSWAAFKKRFPQGDVLSRDTGAQRDYGRNPYEGYDAPDSQPSLLDEEADGRLPPKERVSAVTEAEETVVVPFSTLESEPVVNERVAGKPVVFFFQRGVVGARRRSHLRLGGRGHGGGVRARGRRTHARLRAPRQPLLRSPDRIGLGHHRPGSERRAARQAPAGGAPRRAVLVRAGGVRARRAHRPLMALSRVPVSRTLRAE